MWCSNSLFRVLPYFLASLLRFCFLQELLVVFEIECESMICWSFDKFCTFSSPFQFVPKSHWLHSKWKEMFQNEMLIKKKKLTVKFCLEKKKKLRCSICVCNEGTLVSGTVFRLLIQCGASSRERKGMNLPSLSSVVDHSVWDSLGALLCFALLLSVLDLCSFVVTHHHHVQPPMTVCEKKEKWGDDSFTDLLTTRVFFFFVLLLFFSSSLSSPSGVTPA